MHRMTNAIGAATSGRALMRRATTFAELLRLRMGNLTQAQAAEQIGVSQSRISRWLSGGMPVDHDKQAAVAAWLEVTRPELDDFLRRSHQITRRRTAVERIESLEDTVAQLHEQVRALRAALEAAGVIAPR